MKVLIAATGLTHGTDARLARCPSLPAGLPPRRIDVPSCERSTASETHDRSHRSAAVAADMVVVYEHAVRDRRLAQL
jgi:hypothetical protein